MSVVQEIKNTSRDYPKFLLKANDAYIDLTSKDIFDEGKYNPMFRDLGISEQDLHAEYQLFFHGKHAYSYMILSLLNKWLRKAGAGATFDVLSKALDEHGFHKVTLKLLALYNKQV